MTHPDNQDHPQTKKRYVLNQKQRRERRGRLSSQARYGEGGRFDRLADSLGEIPILGDTALAPMRGFLKGTSKLYQATHDTEGHSEINDLGAVKEVSKDVLKAISGMRK